MSQNKDTGKNQLLQDLENLKDTLSPDTEAPQEQSTNAGIPTLDQVVGHEKTIQQRTENPFLSSETLAQLISKRNDAEARAAEELARIIKKNRITPIDRPAKTAPPSLFDIPDDDHRGDMTEAEQDEFVFPKEESVEAEIAIEEVPKQLFAEELLERLQGELGGIIQHSIEKMLPSFIQKIEMDIMLKLEALIQDTDLSDSDTLPDPDSEQ